MTKTDLKYACTRFAHECRLKGATTNDATIKAFDEWIVDQNVSLDSEETIKALEAKIGELKQLLANYGGDIIKLREEGISKEKVFEAVDGYIQICIDNPPPVDVNDVELKTLRKLKQCLELIPPLKIKLYV